MWLVGFVVVDVGPCHHGPDGGNGVDDHHSGHDEHSGSR